MINQPAGRQLSTLALTCSLSILHILPVIALAQFEDQTVPDIQCAYVEAELTSIFMDQHPSLNVDEEVVELLYLNCADPTPKSRLIYSYIKAANAYLAYEGVNTGQLDESMIYYRQINRDRLFLDQIAASDLRFVQLFEYRYARLAQDLEPRYVESIASNPDRQLGQSRGYSKQPRYVNDLYVYENDNTYGTGEWGATRGSTSYDQGVYRGSANFADNEPEIVYSRGGYRGQDIDPYRQTDPAARTGSYLDFIRSAGADADQLYSQFARKQAAAASNSYYGQR